MRRKTGLRAVTILLAVAVAAACGGDDGEAASDGNDADGSTDDNGTDANGGSEELTTVIFSGVPLAGLAPIWIAQDEGYCEEEGIDLQFQAESTTSATVANLTGGSVEVGFAGTGTILTAAAEGIPISIVGPLYFANGEQGIYVLADSDIQRPADLAGKTVAMGSLRSNGDSGLLLQIEEDGGDPSTAELILLPLPDTPSALRSGRVDAAHVNEPNIARMGDEIRAVVPNLVAPFGEDSPISHVIANTAWAENNPETLESFRRCLFRSMERANDDDDAVRRAVANHTETPEELLEVMVMPGFLNDLGLEPTRRMEEVMTDNGFIEGEVDADALFFPGWPPAG